jgi:uncharacterized membrane protein
MTWTRQKQDGSITILALGLAMTVFATAGVAVDGTRAYISRNRLQNLADAAALAAAARIDIGAYHQSRGTQTVLDIDDARETASRALNGLPSNVESAIQASRDGITIRLSGAVPTSFLGLIGVDELRVVADARARPIVGPVPH